MTKLLHSLPNSMIVGNAEIPFKQSVKDLDFAFDCHLTMNEEFSNSAQICYIIWHLFVDMTNTATVTLVSAIDFSRIDYCKSLQFGSTRD